MPLIALLFAVSCAQVPLVTLATPEAHINFETEVNDMTVTLFILDLNYQLSKNPEKIIIHIDSPGGSVYAGQEMAKAIEASTVPITCVVDGMAASMGLYILQACDYRTMTARSLLMAHGPSTQNASGTAADLAAESDLLLKLSRALAHHIVRRTVYTVDQYLAIIARGDFWIGCETALELGFVDEIIGLKPVN